jgi:hypothetical protein
VIGTTFTGTVHRVRKQRGASGHEEGAAKARNQKGPNTDCYAFDAQMNFGVTAPESIRAACCIADAPKLAEVRQRWTALGVDLGDLRCFEITTNSTASEIRIFAKRFEVSDS